LPVARKNSSEEQLPATSCRLPEKIAPSSKERLARCRAATNLHFFDNFTIPMPHY